MELKKIVIKITEDSSCLFFKNDYGLSKCYLLYCPLEGWSNPWSSLSDTTKIKIDREISIGFEDSVCNYLMSN